MKSLFLTLLAAFSFAASYGQQAKAALQFREAEYSFGKIAQGKPVYHSFVVTNTSGAPVKIDNVQASCGCTTPEWNQQPIAPGGRSVIKVGYNAAAEGPFDKTISVTYGGTTQVLHIKGEVWKTPATPAPANAAVQFLNSRLQP